MVVQTFEAVVVGAGIMGSSTAYFLSKKLGPGKVLLLEQFDYLHKKGSSHGESRIIRNSYPEEFNACLMPDTYKLWAEIEAEAGTKLLTKTGGLTFGKTENDEIKQTIKTLSLLKIPYEVLDANETAQRFPTVSLPEGYIAIYQADAGVLNATKSVATVQFLARHHGCTIYDNTEVIDIQSDGTPNGTITIITRDGQQFISKKCIITAGPWTSKLLAKFPEFDIKLKTVQPTVAYWQVDTPHLFSAKTFPIFMAFDEEQEIEFYGTPALEYPNLIKCSSHGGLPSDPNNRSFLPDTKGLTENVSQFLSNFFKGISQTPLRTESCMYTYSPDRQFIIDNFPSQPNMLIGCGFSGHGFKMGPMVGHILSQLVITGIHPYPHVVPHLGFKRFQN